MPTRDFRALVQRQVAEDSAFAEALLREGIKAIRAGEVEAGRAVLRDCMEATGGLARKPARRPRA